MQSLTYGFMDLVDFFIEDIKRFGFLFPVSCFVVIWKKIF